MKKRYSLFIVCIVTSLSAYIETERTYWKNWTLEDSRVWEEIEQNEDSISFFRRNDYFDPLEDLIKRDRNYLEMSRIICEQYSLNCFLPPLGFAIFNKADDRLIGTIRFKLTDKKGYLSIGYGLSQAARNQKFGNEVMTKLLELFHLSINQPIIALNDSFDRNDFTAEWYEQSVKDNPDFSTLFSYIDKNSTFFKGVIACVDFYNPASISLLMRNGMIPIEVECVQYVRSNAPNLFRFDIFFMFPSDRENYNEKLMELITDVLSRDSVRIKKREESLRTIFSIPMQSEYLHYTRKEKEHFFHEEKSTTAIILSDLHTIKTVSSITLQ